MLYAGPTIADALRHMRQLLALCLVSACSTAPTGAEPAQPSSVRERLATATRLLVAPGASTGAITVGHYSDGAWRSSRVALPIESGELVASADPASGGIVVARFGLGLAPLALPIHDDTQLTHVRLTLGAATPAETTWQGEDAATARASLRLTLSWSLTVASGTSPLSDQQFPAVPIELALAGDGEMVDGTLTVAAPGKLWSWADLVELDDLSLTLAAATTE